MSFNYQVKHFSELSTLEFHDLLALRINVFVVEQNCPYPELDGKDKKSYHLICRDGLGKIVATSRILPQNVSYKEVSIGRVVSAAEVRGKGIGHDMMKYCFQFIKDEFGDVPVKISAQEHLEQFYQQHGFVSTGKKYLEDDIPHVEMIFNEK